MSIAFFLGRIIFGFYWLSAAYGHLINGSHMVGYAQMKGVKSPKLAIFGSGILLFLGGVSILLGLYPTIGLIALVVFLIGVTFKMHAYWKIMDPMQKIGERVNFMKNMALAAALLMMFAIPQPWMYSI